MFYVSQLCRMQFLLDLCIWGSGASAHPPVIVMGSCMLLINHMQHISPKTDSGFLENLNSLPTWGRNPNSTSPPSWRYIFLSWSWNFECCLINISTTCNVGCYFAFSYKVSHLDNNEKVDPDLDKLLIWKERRKSIRFPWFAQKIGGKKVRWQALAINPCKTDNLNSTRNFVSEVWTTFQCLQINDLRWFLQNNCCRHENCKIYYGRWQPPWSRAFHLERFFVEFVLFSRRFFRPKIFPFLDLGKQKIVDQIGTDKATEFLIKGSSFDRKNRHVDFCRQMTGKAMSLVACGAFTEKMNTTSNKNIDMFWNRLLTFIPDTVLQPVVSDATDVRAGEYATYLYIVAHCCEFKCSPGATFWLPACRTGSQWRWQLPSLGIWYVPRFCWVFH